MLTQLTGYDVDLSAMLKMDINIIWTTNNKQFHIYPIYLYV